MFVVKQGLFVGLCLFRLFLLLLLVLRLLLLLLLLLLRLFLLLLLLLLLVLVLRLLLLLLLRLLVLRLLLLRLLVLRLLLVLPFDILEHHYGIPNCLYDYCIVAAPVRTGSTGPLPGAEYTEGVQEPSEIVQDGTGYRVNKSEYHHRAPLQKLKAVPTSSYSTLSNST